MNLCPEHGHIVLTRAKFCPMCGRPLQQMANQVEAALTLADATADTKVLPPAPRLRGLINPPVPPNRPFPTSLF